MVRSTTSHGALSAGAAQVLKGGWRVVIIGPVARGEVAQYCRSVVPGANRAEDGAPTGSLTSVRKYF